MRILLEENYQWSPQQREQSVAKRTQPLQATDWDTEQQFSRGRGTPVEDREHGSCEGGGAQILLDLDNRDEQPWTDGVILWVLVLGHSGGSLDLTWSVNVLEPLVVHTFQLKQQ